MFTTWHTSRSKYILSMVHTDYSGGRGPRINWSFSFGNSNFALWLKNLLKSLLELSWNFHYRFPMSILSCVIIQSRWIQYLVKICQAYFQNYPVSTVSSLVLKKQSVPQTVHTVSIYKPDIHPGEKITSKSVGYIMIISTCL